MSAQRRQRREAAQTLEHDEGHIGQFFRRMRTKLGRAEAITATAHKLAGIFYAIVTTGKPYRESTFAKADEKHRARQEARLRQPARAFGFQLVP